MNPNFTKSFSFSLNDSFFVYSHALCFLACPIIISLCCSQSLVFQKVLNFSTKIPLRAHYHRRRPSRPKHSATTDDSATKTSIDVAESRAKSPEEFSGREAKSPEECQCLFGEQNALEADDALSLRSLDRTYQSVLSSPCCHFDVSKRKKPKLFIAKNP